MEDEEEDLVEDMVDLVDSIVVAPAEDMAVGSVEVLAVDLAEDMVVDTMEDMVVVQAEDMVDPVEGQSTGDDYPCPITPFQPMMTLL